MWPALRWGSLGSSRETWRAFSFLSWEASFCCGWGGEWSGDLPDMYWMRENGSGNANATRVTWRGPSREGDGQRGESLLESVVGYHRSRLHCLGERTGVRRRDFLLHRPQTLGPRVVQPGGLRSGFGETHIEETGFTRVSSWYAGCSCWAWAPSSCSPA